MKESEAKTKTCPHMLGNLPLFGIIAKNQYGISGQDAKGFINSLGSCNGSECMMWEPEYRTEDHECTETQNEADSKPEGEGWYVSGRLGNGNRPATINWRRHVPIDSGDCGLKTKELYCNV